MQEAHTSWPALNNERPRILRGTQGVDEIHPDDRVAPVFHSYPEAAAYKRRMKGLGRCVELASTWSHIENCILQRRADLRQQAGEMKWRRFREFCVNKRDAPLLSYDRGEGLSVLR